MILRTDLSIVQLPATPNFGGLTGRNTIQPDPDFGTQIVRVTDSSDNAGTSLLTSDGGNSGLWNASETMMTLRSPGGNAFVFQFHPGKMTADNLGIKLPGKLCFSETQPSVLYQLVKTVIWRHKFQLVSGAWKYVSKSLLVDFAKILPADFKTLWVGTFCISHDDSTFLVGFSEGVQNSAIYACVWQKGHGTGLGFRRLDTNLGIVTGDWGETGALRLVSPNTTIPFTMHECKVSPNRDYGFIGPFGPNGRPLFWKIDSLDLVDSLISGHSADGFLHRYAGGPGGGQIKEILYSDPSQTRLIVPVSGLPAHQTPPQHYDGDAHYGFGLISPTDDSIFWVSSQSQTYPFTSCWMNEVRGYAAQTGSVQRACHTFNSGLSSEFIAAHAIAVPSPRGNFVAFASDMMQTLGDGRADTFVVKVT